MIAKSYINIATVESYTKKVLESELPVIVDFWAEWCGPCHALAPVLDEASQKFADRIRFVKVNVDENAELSEQYSIQAIPTLLFIKEGQIVDRILGVISKKNLFDIIENNLNNHTNEGVHHE